MKLTKEEKIRRLKEQIEQLENGEDPRDKTVFENKHFYVKRYGGLQYKNRPPKPYRYEQYLKTGNCIRGNLRTYEKTGSYISYTSLDQFEKDVNELISFLREVKHEAGSAED